MSKKAPFKSPTEVYHSESNQWVRKLMKPVPELIDFLRILSLTPLISLRRREVSVPIP
jgi:hypothetical protein